MVFVEYMNSLKLDKSYHDIINVDYFANWCTEYCFEIQFIKWSLTVLFPEDNFLWHSNCSLSWPIVWPTLLIISYKLFSSWLGDSGLWEAAEQFHLVFVLFFTAVFFYHQKFSHIVQVCTKTLSRMRFFWRGSDLKFLFVNVFVNAVGWECFSVSFWCTSRAEGTGASVRRSAWLCNSWSDVHSAWWWLPFVLWSWRLFEANTLPVCLTWIFTPSESLRS